MSVIVNNAVKCDQVARANRSEKKHRYYSTPAVAEPVRAQPEKCEYVKWICKQYNTDDNKMRATNARPSVRSQSNIKTLIGVKSHKIDVHRVELM